MSEKIDKYIADYTRNCSNELDFSDFENGMKRLKEYQPWLTPDHARAVAEIAREETIEKICEWLKNGQRFVVETPQYSYFDHKKAIESLREYVEDKV